jgi:hypothetical protein
MAAYVDVSSIDCCTSSLVSDPVPSSETQLPVHDESIATAMITLDLADLSIAGLLMANRSAARRWVVEMLENFVKNNGTSMRGTLTKVLPLSADSGTITKRLRIEIKNTFEDTMQQIVVPALRQHGRVQRIVAEEASAQFTHDQQFGLRKAAAAAAVGDVSGTKDLLNKWTTMRGEGGSPRKKRKCVDNMVMLLERSQRVATHKMREMVETEVEERHDDSE